MRKYNEVRFQHSSNKNPVTPLVPVVTHRQVTWLPVDFHAQIGWKMVFLRTARLRQAKPQLNLNWEVTFGPRDVPLSTETHLSPHICRTHVHLSIIQHPAPTERRSSYIELLICWTCCGVNAKAKHVSWNRWLLSDAAERDREEGRHFKLT